MVRRDWVGVYLWVELNDCYFDYGRHCEWQVAYEIRLDCCADTNSG